ncbi:MAG: 6,7-dimethyl-8-ribityllumazine synthase [Thermoguttaceae bacterium]|nr:6,7-dimethyl-8-ribityllumazine synthase [Thermoguttaceae bacterium]
MTVYEGKYPPVGAGKIAVVVSKYNKPITERLLDGTLATLKEGGVREADIDVIWVPGAFEIPMMAQRFAFDDEYQAVVCLGCVIKGETTHDEHINRAVSLQLARISVDAGVPVAFGVLTCNTVEQAQARSTAALPGSDKTAGEILGNKGAEAASAVLEMLDILSQLPDLPEDALDPAFYSSLAENVRRYRGGEFDDDGDDEEYAPLNEEDKFGFPHGRHSHHRDHSSRGFSPPRGGYDFPKHGKSHHHGKGFRQERKGGSGDHGKKGKSKFPKKGK